LYAIGLCFHHIIEVFWLWGSNLGQRLVLAKEFDYAPVHPSLVASLGPSQCRSYGSRGEKGGEENPLTQRVGARRGASPSTELVAAGWPNPNGVAAHRCSTMVA
jgi:hypothetical protein